MNNTRSFATLFAVFLFISTYGQKPARASGDSALHHSFFVRSPWLTFTNWMDEKSVEMYELHVGYRITTRDIVAIKAATWKLFEPMGIPWGPHKIQDEEAYPGRLREYGVGVCYQRMLWKGAFAAVEVMPMKKVFLDESDKQLDTGFKLYTSYHLGYQWNLCRKRLLLEPQIHFNYWPVDSEGPAQFKEMEDRWNNYFLWEPNLYIGYNFLR